jgi:molybdate transport system regulatory protein
MAGHKGSKYYDIFLRQRLDLVNRDNVVVINEEGFTLLTEIMKEQSIAASAAKMKISYRKAWGLLREIEGVLGFKLILRHRGGKDGGKTLLSAEGIELTIAYQDLRKNADSAVYTTVKDFFKRINSISASE